MRFSEPFLLSLHLSLGLTFAASSPSPAYDLSASSSLLQKRGQCASCQKSGSPPANGLPQISPVSMSRPLGDFADSHMAHNLPDGPASPRATEHPAVSSHNEGLRGTPGIYRLQAASLPQGAESLRAASHYQAPPAPPPQGRYVLGTSSSHRSAAASRTGQSPVNVAGLSSVSERPMAERWARRIALLHQVDPEFSHPDAAASPRWEANRAIFPSAASPGVVSSKASTVWKDMKVRKRALDRVQVSRLRERKLFRKELLLQRAWAARM